MPLKDQFRLWRLSQNFTQEELARRSGVSRTNLAALESGKESVTLLTLKRLAQALGTTPGRLLDQNPWQDLHFDRHQLDALARSLISGTASPAPALANALQDYFSPLLSLCGNRPNQKKRGRPATPGTSGLLLKQVLSRGTLRQLTRRVNTLVAQQVSRHG